MATDKESSKTSSNTIEPGDLSKLLKEYRETAQLNIDQVSDALCLTTSSIKALESESFSTLPEPPYVRGYLRNYAGLADKDPKPLIDTYNALAGNSSTTDENNLNANTINNHQEVATPLITPQRFRLALLTALLLILAMLTMIPGVRDWTSNLWSNFSTTPDTTITDKSADTETSLNLPSLTGDVPGNLPITPAEEVEPASKDQPDNQESIDETADEAIDETATDTIDEENSTAETVNNETKDQETSTSSESEAIATDENTTNEEDSPNENGSSSDQNTATNVDTNAEGNTQLKLVFNEEVWIRIKDGNGKTVFEALHPANTEKELSLNSPLKFRVGNAQGMKFFVNGEEMDISQFTEGSVANFGIE